jgi:hypothetical protein
VISKYLKCKNMEMIREGVDNERRRTGAASGHSCAFKIDFSMCNKMVNLGF